MKKLLSAMLFILALSIAGQATNLYLSRGGSQKKAETQSTTVKSSKSNSSERAAEDKNSKTVTGKVIRVAEKEKTFTITANSKELTFDAKALKALPKVGETIDVTYTEAAGGQLRASNLNLSKSNIARVAPDGKDTPKAIAGKVIRVNDKEKTFVALIDGKEASFSAQKMKSLPKVGATIDLKPNAARFVFNSCEECNAKCPGVCFLEGIGYCRCYLEHLRTQHN